MVEKLLKDASVICSPGNGFGAEGEGYIRMTFTVNQERIQEAVQRIKQIHW
jgi:LL-diaminopimelate aminotransferase